MHILIDQDGVLADFEACTLASWQELHPGEYFRPYEEREHFYMSQDWPEELRPKLACIYEEAGFYRRLPLVSGSVEAIREMLSLGHTISICTAPLEANPTCMNDKFAWLIEHFGADIARLMVVATDKTLVRGDLLIDDRPELKGMMEPTWEHVLYDRPYNRRTNGKRRLTWENWREVLQL